MPIPNSQSNVARLAIAQALAGANSTVIYATGAVIGDLLAPDKSLATLPITTFVVGMAVATLPTGMLGRRYGRRTTFLLGNVCGVLVGLLAALGLLTNSFAIFCVAMLFGGAYAAIVLSFRFAAAECVEPAKRARALSTVMAGGVVAGVVGPQLTTYTMNLWPPHVFAVTYLAAAVVAVLSAMVLSGVKLPRPAPAEQVPGRPLSEVARQPRFIAAAICGVISYMLMNFLMTSAPLAMKLCGIGQVSSNMGLQWHVVAMYGPSFITGSLIARFGATRIVLLGLALLVASAAVGLAGIDVAHFVVSLILLGVGWNLGFVGASALILETHRPEERTRVQALNDFIVFGAMVIGSFASGGLLSRYGWNVVCLVAFPPLALAAGALVLLSRSRSAPATIQ